MTIAYAIRPIGVGAEITSLRRSGPTDAETALAIRAAWTAGDRPLSGAGRDIRD